jgi:hypothetical protein
VHARGYCAAVGDYFEIIADVEATETEAPELAASVVAWLAREGIIAAEPADCVLGAESGYPPGPRYTVAVTEPADWLPRLHINGIEVCASRTVFLAGQGKPGPVVCPHCRQRVELEDPATGQSTPQWESFSDALTAWMEDGPGEVRCRQCGQMAGFNDWRWIGEPFAIGFLGFTFWNWPPLSESFIVQMASHLEHRVVVIRGKL